MTFDKKAHNNKYLELLSKRNENIEVAAQWPIFEIKEELARTVLAKEIALEKNPNHDTCILDEHIEQLKESLRLSAIRSRSAEL